jgi:hypothetical protein
MAANQTFTVHLRTMGGNIIDIPNVSMNTDVDILKSEIARQYFNNIHPKNIQLTYFTDQNGYRFMELLDGKLNEYDINFYDPNTTLELLIGKPKRIYNNSQEILATLLTNPQYLVPIPPNTTIVDSVSPDLKFRKIYILNRPGDKTGLPCTVMYITKPHMLLSGTPDSYNKTVIDVHNPEVRLSTIEELTSSLLYPYVINGRVLVEEPTHGGRKKRTRRTRRKLHKKRTHRKRRNHRRMSR